MQDALTLLSYVMVGYVIAPVLILVLASLCKEIRHEQPLRSVLWFGVAMITLCVVVILFIGLHRATATLGKPANHIEFHEKAR
jgi:peptidoglycan/LPS O-acetylase OafA/YrhL